MHKAHKFALPSTQRKSSADLLLLAGTILTAAEVGAVGASIAPAVIALLLGVTGSHVQVPVGSPVLKLPVVTRSADAASKTASVFPPDTKTWSLMMLT